MLQLSISEDDSPGLKHWFDVAAMLVRPLFPLWER
jgi:hypothetical protein